MIARSRVSSSGAGCRPGATHRDRLRGRCYRARLAPLGAGPAVLLPVEDVRAGDRGVPAAHQRELDLILHLFEIDRPVGRAVPAEQGVGDRVRHLGDFRAQPGRSARRITLHGQERLRDGHRDPAGIKIGDAAVPARHPHSMAGDCFRWRCAGKCSGHCSLLASRMMRRDSGGTDRPAAVSEGLIPQRPSYGVHRRRVPTARASKAGLRTRGHDQHQHRSPTGRRFPDTWASSA